MIHFRILLLSCLVLATSSASPQSAAPPDETISPKARAIHDSALVVDTHADTPQRFLDEGFDMGSTDPKDVGHISLDKARRGNLGAEFFSIWVEPETNQGHFARHTFDLIDSVYQQAARHPDIERAHKEHKLAALMGIEGGHSIENDMHLLRDYYRLGVRYMTLSWSNTNEWADSSGDINDPKVQHHNGLTDFDKQVVLEMNRLGMMVDISHVADKTFWDAIATTKAPLIASHSSARALTNAPRNMTDEMLEAVAKNGGVVQVNFYSGFVDESYRNASQLIGKQSAEAMRVFAEKQKADGKPVSYIEIDRIDHIAKVAGIDHVGLGSDFDGVSGATPAGIDSAADLPKITQALLDRGYGADDIKKILGGNILRVFRQVEDVSREMPSDSQSH